MYIIAFDLIFDHAVLYKTLSVSQKSSNFTFGNSYLSAKSILKLFGLEIAKYTSSRSNLIKYGVMYIKRVIPPPLVPWLFVNVTALLEIDNVLDIIVISPLNGERLLINMALVHVK